ncbi:uncharacterized protein ASPGLDRAFT_523784 [Aspergillus glaucus CBS 516.65]|uniref:Uncharacterized protein n=1 Tax=Aspergillus glaucus CBS 516.65 TaxID=1160497 RepID=A0A1L9VED5_ASPGL|nr:hypothetical protein ASPGLDRAFT_523784 [Aspergillus glaucus CBS 516.65]OJJ82311.1 hypothetical protein ASPGLDRAFT_523784 [Aspergillus glaucus CBS 516.65]
MRIGSWILGYFRATHSITCSHLDFTCRKATRLALPTEFRTWRKSDDSPALLLYLFLPLCCCRCCAGPWGVRRNFQVLRTLRGGCPDGVMLDEHDLQLVMFFVQRYSVLLYSALYRITGLLVGAIQADKVASLIRPSWEQQTTFNKGD